MRTPLCFAFAFGVLVLASGADARSKPAREMSYAPGLAPHAMVAAANPLAVKAGLKILREGGSAADAAVAVQAVLGLVEPQSSGLGGGAFMVFHDGHTGKTVVYDGRETAPAGASPDMFLDATGKPLGHFAGVMSGRSTGAPGAMAMLARAQAEHGRLRGWGAAFDPAIRLAQEGFAVSPRMAGMVALKFPAARTPDANAYFTKPDGTRYVAGDVLKNAAYAGVLKRLAKEGPDAILKGKVAAGITAKVREAPLPGTLSEADLAAYQPKVREALCRPYRAYVVCAPPPPGGGVGVLEILGILETTDIAARGPMDPQAWVLFAQASRLAYADRDHYVGDPGFVTVPAEGMIDPAYDAARAALIPTTGAAAPAFGTPPGAPAAGPDKTPEPGGTSSFVIVDRWGNVVSMTTTVESVFGSGRMVEGFFLNNQLTDFSFSPLDPVTGAPAANAVAAGKRPRSSMSPVIVFERLPGKGGAPDKAGRFVLAVGSPGGNSIIAYVAKALVGILDWKMDPKAAITLPNIVARGAVISVEKGADPAVVAALKARGLTVAADAGEESGLHVVIRRKGGYAGAADPRREGVADGY